MEGRLMRIGALVVAVALTVAGCSSPSSNPAEAPAAPAANAGPRTQPYGNLAQMMQAIPFPASNIIFDTQTNDPGAAKEAGRADAGATAAFSGVYGGWTAVENAAIALQETANLVMIPGRKCRNGRDVPIDQEIFKKGAQALADAGAAALKAAQSKNLDAMVDVSGTVSDACTVCHEKYRDTPDEKDRCM
jgi:cytochrome c556